MKTSAAVGFVLAALCACMTPQGTTTTGGDVSSSSGGAESTTGDPTNSHETEVIQTVTSESDTGPTGSTTADPVTTGDTSTGDSSTGDACHGVIEAVAGQLAGPRCELLLQFDSDGVLDAWQSTCGAVPADAFDAKSALAATACCSDGVFLNVPDMDDNILSPFAVYEAPVAPMDGGVALVSNHLGVVVFEGIIGADAPGMISVPKPWSPAEALTDPGDCSGPAFLLPGLISYHAGDGSNAADIDEVLGDAIADTILPAAFDQALVKVDRSVLLGYEDFAGAPTTYIVLLELSAA